MKTRRQQRIKAMEILYTMDLQENQSYEPINNAFIDEIVRGVLKHQAILDELIQNNLLKYTLKRLSYVDRAIIRIATYEMYASKTPVEIIINEALEITREYSDEGNEKMVGFTNSVLDKIKQALNR